MDISEILKRRRMVRCFADTPVPGEVLVRIARAAQRAPSAGHTQGQRLIVVTDPHRRAKVAEAVGEAEYVAKGACHWISRCGAQFIPCVSERLYHERYREPDKLDSKGREEEWAVPYWWVDVGFTTMLILLAAVNEGLGAGFTGPYPAPYATMALRGELQIPDDFEPVGVIAVGYSLEDEAQPLRSPRLPGDVFVHWEGW